MFRYIFTILKIKLKYRKVKKSKLTHALEHRVSLAARSRSRAAIAEALGVGRFISPIHQVLLAA